MDSHYAENNPNGSHRVGYRAYQNDRETPTRLPRDDENPEDYAEKPEEGDGDNGPPPPSRLARIPRRLRIVAFLALVLIAIPVSYSGWSYLQSYQSTDDAQVDGHIDPISSRINGTVSKVLVEDNQSVAAGQLLVEIDPRDYQVALDQARAQVAQAEAQVAAAKQNYAAAVATVHEAQASNYKAQRDAARYSALLRAQVVAPAQYDQYIATARVSAAQLDANQQQAGSAERAIATAQANAQAAQAALDQAALNLSYTKIYAPAAGIIGKKTVELGQRVQPGEEMFAVVQRDVWITANFKETQLRRMARGQPATIHVDAFGRDYNGYVEAMPGASGDRFSLLPPENATGNYVKVVQRLPVRIQLDQGENADHRLRPGMNVEADVWLNRNPARKG
ncbi:MAG TPA: HlyD family secretion protein [Candidatus Binataceae bacterium]|nr:HlyD family secretion protein [Candidatus Binataceae bacterium]